MSDIMDFGFDDSKVIRTSNVEYFKQTKPNERTRISIVSFKRFSDGEIARKQRDKGALLSDSEKSDVITKVEKKLAEQLGKSVKDLTEADRLDIKTPRFGVANTHYREGIGTIRCQSKWDSGTLTKQELCCEKLGDPDQTIATILMTYPVNREMGVEVDIFAAKKYVSFYVWRMTSKKFQKVESAYRSAREDNKTVIDLKVTLDGDPKYQKQNFETVTAHWAKEEVDPEIRHWVLEQGLRLFRNIDSALGYKMPVPMLMERLGMGTGGDSHGSDEKPKLIRNYAEVID